MRRKPKIDAPFAWAWKMEDGLCRWAQPYRWQLDPNEKPSPEAKRVRVRLVENRLFKRLRKP